MAEKVAVTSLCWLPAGSVSAKGAAPGRRFAEFAENEDSDDQATIAAEEDAVAGEKNGKPAQKGGKSEKAGSNKAGKNRPLTLDEEFDLDNYDDEPGAADALNDASMGGADPNFGNCFSVTDEDRALAFNDPDLSPEQQDSDSEGSDHEVQASDKLFLSLACEDDACVAEVYVYDDENQAMFVHHELLLNAYPLCADYLSLPGAGSSSSAAGGGARHCAAVGGFDHSIDIWNLGDADAMEPELRLEGEVVARGGAGARGGAKKRQGAVTKANGKKKMTAAGLDPTKGHAGPVMCLEANRLQQNVLASGSADHVVKLWDLGSGKCASSFTHHKSKVQCVRWHAEEPSLLLTAGYDKKVCFLDVREGDKRPVTLALDADAEQALWHDSDPNLCFVSTEKGSVFCYDVRKVIGGGDATPALWRLDAYAGKKQTACSGLAQSGRALVTAGTDGVAKVFDLAKSCGDELEPLLAPELAFQKGLSAGALFSCAASGRTGGMRGAAAGAAQPASYFGGGADPLFVFGGHTVAMWDLRGEEKLCDRFGWRWDGQKKAEEGEEGAKTKRKRSKRSF